MAENDGHPVPPEDEVVYLDEDGGPEDVANALEAAERAVAAWKSNAADARARGPRQPRESH